VAGFLPTAGIAFLDEVFKANSAILNALLTLLNEREFDNGSGRTPTPLLSVVAASNEVPVDEALQAFFDRFLLRLPVDASFAALLGLPARSAPGQARLRAADLQPLRERAQQVALAPEITDLLVQARAWCAQQAVTVSDRRWRKLVGLLQLQAASRGSGAVQAWDLWLLPYALGARPEQVQALATWFDQTVALAIPLDLQWLARAAKAFEKQLEIETAAQRDGDGDGAGKIALAQAISSQGAGQDNTMLRLVSDRARRRYSQGHVDARMAQLAELQQRAASTARLAQDAADTALGAAREHAWLPPSWRARIAAIHEANVALARAQCDGLELLASGFAGLPVDTALDGAPALITVDD
jgi:MoxR-like ATPase